MILDRTRFEVVKQLTKTEKNWIRILFITNIEGYSGGLIFICGIIRDDGTVNEL